MTPLRQPKATTVADGTDKAPSVPRDIQVVRWTAAGIAPLIAALAVLGGLGSFTTIKQMAAPHFGGLAWIVPVGMDVGILILLAWDLLMEYLDLPWPVLRWVAWLYIAGTVLVNVSAAHGSFAGSVMNAAMPVLFITVIEGVRHLIRRWVGLTSARRVERVPTARWALAPISSLLLWRRMILWHITEYRQGLELQQRHLAAVSQLQQDYGRWSWRWRAPLADRLALNRLSDAETAAYDGTGENAADGKQDGQLMAIARQLQQEAEREGVLLGRDRLGHRLRERGFTIANHRLTQMIAAVRAESARRQS
ncbi:DUF2637 domain-containing protein [Actinomadura geliboluensis]|uniref:DUF2637 domain-containing protein n=1 Tax=Actinomadura geliboluensis TaxID=882440 RepID=A0A5S4GAI2_9ACTN|nr:DUF2637 domain-containing protein [Actinomadura geliboluensis]TMR29882.1 DUF2637 domain-containing protein [Actinomadura geliboluensis]